MNQSPQGVFALFKGDNGAGKTVAAASFPDPIILDFDKKGPAVVRKHYPEKVIPYQQFPDALVAGELVERWENEGCPFETIVVDSVTALSYLCMATVDLFRKTNILTVFRSLKEEGDKAQTKGKAPSIAKALTEYRTYEHFNAEDGYLKMYVDTLKRMWIKPGKPHNVIFTAHVLESSVTDIKTQAVTKTRKILTQGNKIAVYIPAQFDDTWQFYVRPGEVLSGKSAEHWCYTEAVGEDYAKTAYRLEKKIDFTNKNFYDLIKDNLSETETETTSKVPERKLLQL